MNSLSIKTMLKTQNYRAWEEIKNKPDLYEHPTLFLTLVPLAFPHQCVHILLSVELILFQSSNQLKYEARNT